MTELTADRVHIRQLLHLEHNPGTYGVTLEPPHAPMTLMSCHRTWLGARWRQHTVRRQLRRRAWSMTAHPAGLDRDLTRRPR